MRKHILASVCLAILALSMVSILLPAMKVPTAKAQLTDNWLVASTQAVYGYGGSGTSFTSLSLTVPSGFNLTSEIGGTPPIFVSNALTITSVASGNGYYLVGLDQPITNWPEYTSAVSTPHLYKFDGSNWSPVGGGTLDDVQITGIHKYLNEFIIVGWYMSFGWSTCYGRVYTYDGSTLTDITTAVLGGNSGKSLRLFVTVEITFFSGNTMQDQAIIHLSSSGMVRLQRLFTNILVEVHTASLGTIHD